MISSSHTLVREFVSKSKVDSVKRELDTVQDRFGKVIHILQPTLPFTVSDALLSGDETQFYDSLRVFEEILQRNSTARGLETSFILQQQLGNQQQNVICQLWNFNFD